MHIMFHNNTGLLLLPQHSLYCTHYNVYVLFIDEEPYYSCLTESVTNIPGNMFLISRDLKTVFCGVLMDGKEFLLIIPAENKSDADRTLKSGLEQSQPLSRWLSDYPLFL